jgi:predicted membrane-bound spermidine synthase
LVTLYRRKGKNQAWSESISILKNPINATTVFSLLITSLIFPMLLIPSLGLILYHTVPRAWNFWKLRHEIKYADSKKLYLAMPPYLILKILLQGLGTFLGMLNLLFLFVMMPLNKSKSSKKY